MKAFRTALQTVILAAAFLAAKETEPLRIATFNLKWLTESATESRMAPWKTESELAAHRRNLARIIASIRPDVLCVQEVTSRTALDKLLAETALMPFRYRVLHLESEDTSTGQDVAFLVSPRVRLDTLWRDGDPALIRRFADTLAGRPPGLYRNDTRRQRLTKHALICLSQPERICLLGLHLLAHPDHPDRTTRRETQARIAAYIAHTEISEKGYATIMLGDFNDFDPDVPETPESGNAKRRVLSILKDVDPDRPGPELFNAAKLVQPPSARYASWWDKNRNGRRDTTDPVSLIDHILVDRALKAKVRSVDIRHGLHDGEVSDHWPVTLDIGLSASKKGLEKSKR